MSMYKKRIWYCDYLRIIATIGVVFIHVVDYYWKLVPFTSKEWMILNVFNSVVRSSVPIFVMISGVMFLSSTRSLKDIYKKNILHIIISFLFWSTVYALFELYAGGVQSKKPYSI